MINALGSSELISMARLIRSTRGMYSIVGSEKQEAWSSTAQVQTSRTRLKRRDVENKILLVCSWFAQVLLVFYCDPVKSYF